MIRLAARLAVSGGRESIVRLVLTALGVAIGTTLLLVAAAADPAIRAQQRHTAWQYTGITGDPGPAPSDLDGGPDPLRWSLTNDAVDGREMTVLRVAAMGPDSPVPLGLSRVPRAGEVYVSPALAQLLEELPADRLADRFPSAPTGTHRRRLPGWSRRPRRRHRDDRRRAPRTASDGGPPHPHRPGAVPVHGLPAHHVRRRRRRPAAARARVGHDLDPHRRGAPRAALRRPPPRRRHAAADPCPRRRRGRRGRRHRRRPRLVGLRARSPLRRPHRDRRPPVLRRRRPRRARAPRRHPAWRSQCWPSWPRR